MSGRHRGPRLNLRGFADRAGIDYGTLRSYRSRPIAANPVPAPCWPDDGVTRDTWCTDHVDAWIAARPRRAG